MIIYDGIVFSLQKMGGISIYYNEIFSRLKLNNIEFNLISYDNSNCIVNEYVDNVISKRARCSVGFERYLDCKCKDYNIFHSTYYRLPKSNSGRIVTTVHDFTYEIYNSGIKRLVHSYQKKRAILNSDAIICISENTKKDLLHFIPECNEDKIHVIYNGVSEKFYPLECKKELKGKYVLFIGARGGYKNFHSVIKAMAEHKDLLLIIVGGGGLSLEEIKVLTDSIPSRYSYYSNVTTENLNLLYNNAFCLVYPSLYEGFGIPVIEAMKAGCPVITTNSSSLPEVAGKAAILLNEPDVNSIADAIQELYEDSFRQNLVELGFSQASRFSWEITYLKTLELYDSLLG